MAFPYPKEPNLWQTAYTRSQAYRDSEKSSFAFIQPVGLGILLALGYGILKSILLIGHFSTFTWLMTVLAILVLVLLASAAILMGAFRYATDLFTRFYSPPINIDPRQVISFRLFGIPRPLPAPLNIMSHTNYIVAKDGDLEKKDKWTTWMAYNLGGPLALTVFDGNALYLERGGLFSRVVGPGEKVPFLELHEKVKYVVDLRPKVKTDVVHAWTKDGIKITLTVQIKCQVGDPGKKDPKAGLVFPYNPESVKKAIERTALRWPKDQEPEEYTWVDATWGQVTGIIPAYVGCRMLDDILIADRENGQILSSDAIDKIHQDLNKETNKFGVYITDMQITNVEIPKEVTSQHNKNWGAERQSISMIIDGQAKAFSIRSREKARADAQRDLILAIAEGLEKNKSKKFIEPLLLSLSGVLDSSLSDPQLRAYLAKETLETLEKLQILLDKPAAKGN